MYTKADINREELRSVLLRQLEHVAARLRRHGLCARTVTLKVRSAAFVTMTRRVTLEQATDRTDILWQAAAELFEAWARDVRCAVRLIGVGVSQLADAGTHQLSLFEHRQEIRQRQLDRTLDEIRARFGSNAISRGGHADTPQANEAPGGNQSQVSP